MVTTGRNSRKGTVVHEVLHPTVGLAVCRRTVKHLVGRPQRFPVLEVDFGASLLYCSSPRWHTVSSFGGAYVLAEFVVVTAFMGVHDVETLDSLSCKVSTALV